MLKSAQSAFPDSLFTPILLPQFGAAGSAGATAHHGFPGTGSPPPPSLGPLQGSLSGSICSPPLCHPQLFLATVPFHFLLCLFLPRWFPDITCSPLLPQLSLHAPLSLWLAPAQPESHSRGQTQSAVRSAIKSPFCPFLARWPWQTSSL